MNPEPQSPAPQAAPPSVAAQDVPAIGSSAAERARQEARRRVLHEFTVDVRRRLEGDTSPAGQLVSNHIGRQLDLAGSERYTRWFRDEGERSGFDQSTTLAAVAGSDVTKAAPFSEAARAQFGTTAEHVATLVAQDDLRFGRAFAAFTPLEDLYMHAEAGRCYTQADLARRGAAALGRGDAEQLARETAEAILGHDSFNAGFGRRKLKPLLIARHREPAEAFDYPTSRTPSGFLVQVLDRIEGCDPETMLRYVTEEIVQRQGSIAQAIEIGLIDNFHFLLEVYEQIVRDSLAVLAPSQVPVFRESPAMQDFILGLRRIAKILVLLGDPPILHPDGFYHLKRGTHRVRLDSLEAFRENFLAAAAVVVA